MKRLYEYFLFLFLCTEFGISAKLPRDIADEARQQLEELKSIVVGAILIAHDDLSNLENDFLTNSHNVLTDGGIVIQQQQETVEIQLQSIKDLAHAANVDVSSCVNIREELLNRLPKEYNNQMRNCIFSFNQQEIELISQVKYIVDVIINQVHRLEFQLNQCKEDILCISPLVTEIELDKVQLPQNIKTEVDSVETVSSSLKLSVNECKETKISTYIGDASSIIQDIIICVDRIIG